MSYAPLTLDGSTLETGLSLFTSFARSDSEGTLMQIEGHPDDIVVHVSSPADRPFPV